mmetsp:Transcript_4661/g.19116  ORF Transcript_4661/g.19116 Transcript_4661/m.19116 type:complete len:267 (+) Transcript_4661:243-1043(+)
MSSRLSFCFCASLHSAAAHGPVPSLAPHCAACLTVTASHSPSDASTSRYPGCGSGIKTCETSGTDDTPPFFPSRSPMDLDTASPPGHTLSGPTGLPSSNAVARTSPPRSSTRRRSDADVSSRCSGVSRTGAHPLPQSSVARESPTAAEWTCLPLTTHIVAVAPLCTSLARNCASTSSNARARASAMRSSKTSSGSASFGAGPGASRAFRMAGTNASAQCSAAALPPCPSNRPNASKRTPRHSAPGAAKDLSSPFMTFLECATRHGG